MPDPDLIDHVLTDAMWTLIAASVLGVAVCVVRMRRAARRIATTPHDDTSVDTHDQLISKEN